MIVHAQPQRRHPRRTYFVLVSCGVVCCHHRKPSNMSSVSSPRSVTSSLAPPSLALDTLRAVRRVAAVCKVNAGGQVILRLSVAVVSSGDTRTAERALQRAARRAKQATTYAYHLNLQRLAASKVGVPPVAPVLPPPVSIVPPPPPMVADTGRAVRASLSVGDAGEIILRLKACGESERRPALGVAARCLVSSMRGQGSTSWVIKLHLHVACISGGTGASLRTAERAMNRAYALQHAVHVVRKAQGRPTRLELPSKKRSQRLLDIARRRGVRAATTISSAGRGFLARIAYARLRATRSEDNDQVIDAFLNSLIPHPARLSTILTHSPSSPWTLLATAWPDHWCQHVEEQNRSHGLCFQQWSRRPVVFNDGQPKAVYRFSEEPGRPLQPGMPPIGRETGFEWD